MSTVTPHPWRAAVVSTGDLGGEPSSWREIGCARAGSRLPAGHDAADHVLLRRPPSPPEVISHAVWLYFRSPLGLRVVDEVLAPGGIVVSHETVRQWGLKF